MTITRQLLETSLLALLIVLGAAPIQAQDTTKQSSNTKGFVEFGFRGITGDVSQRTGLGETPFSNGFRPDILNSVFNTYRDIRNSLIIPRADLFMENVFGTKNYFSLQTASNGLAFEGNSLIRDNTILATYGQLGTYKLQFRWDQTPHIYSGTTRTLFYESSPGVLKFAGDRAPLQAANIAATAVAFTNALTPQVPNVSLDVQRNIRRNARFLASWDIKPEWNVSLLYTREGQDGSRPLGMCFGNNPSCVWAEIPESLDYTTNTVKATTELGHKDWGLLLGYSHQSFVNNVQNLLVDNPFSNGTNSETITSNGQISLYPNNQMQDFQVAGALHHGKLHAMTSITPGWQTQNEPFVPYTTNSFLLNRTGPAAAIPLPASSLDGKRQTLAMNYTLQYNATKNLELTAKYRHFDFNNNTEERQFNPYVGDLSAEVALAGPSGQEVRGIVGINGVVDAHCQGVCNEIFAFNTRDIDLGGTYFFSKKSSAKVEYGRQWFNRHERDVSQTIEDSIKVAFDLKPIDGLTLRLTGIHQNREPQDADYEWALIPGTQRPDEGFRSRKRADLLAQYDVTSRLSVSGFFGTTQDNFNHRSRLTSLTPLGDVSLITAPRVAPTPIYGPYYVFGLLNNFAWNAGGDFDLLIGENVTFFGEYSRERNTNRMVSRQRSRNTASQLGCPSVVGPEDCDPINDWMTASKDIIDSYFVGFDLLPNKKFQINLYYGLSATKSTTLSNGVNCQVINGPNANCRNNFPNWRLDTAASPAVTFDFPENVTRLHEVGAILKLKLTENVVPKFEYRYQRSDYKDFQTSVMNPFAFVGPAADPGGATGLQRMLFMGADTPGYNVHVFTATIEYHF